MSNSTLPDELFKSMHDHWRLFLAEGIILIVLGIGAVAIPPLAGLAATIFLGWLLLVAGLVGLLFTLRGRQAPGFGWALVSALVAILTGALLLWNPFRGLATLTYVLIAYFLIDGVLTIFLAVDHRRELSGRWEWILVNGVIDLVLAGVILAGLPGTLVWAFGLIVGIDLMFGGSALVALALDARKTAT